MKGRQNMTAMVSDTANSTVKKSQIVYGHINEHEIYFKLNLKYWGFMTPVFSEYKPTQLNLDQELQFKTIEKMTPELI